MEKKDERVEHLLKTIEERDEKIMLLDQAMMIESRRLINRQDNIIDGLIQALQIPRS